MWVAGAVLCTVTAAAVTAIFAGHADRGILPLAFLLVITPVALYFGTIAGILGSLCAAAIFAVFLFAPIGSLQVDDLAERSNLAWLLLGGIAISYLLAPPHNPGDQR